MAKKKSSKFSKVETFLKGAANVKRLELMELIKKHPDLSGEDIAEKKKMNYQTCSDHLRKLVKSGLVGTYREGNRTNHVLSNLGEDLFQYLADLEL